MSTAVKYIKSFSHGQITIPKEIREFLGLGENFWLKLTIKNGRIVAEPAVKQNNQSDYRKTLQGIKTVIDLESELQTNKMNWNKKSITELHEKTSC